MNDDDLKCDNILQLQHFKPNQSGSPNSPNLKFFSLATQTANQPENLIPNPGSNSDRSNPSESQKPFKPLRLLGDQKANRATILPALQRHQLSHPQHQHQQKVQPAPFFSLLKQSPKTPTPTLSNPNHDVEVQSKRSVDSVPKLQQYALSGAPVHFMLAYH
jgi:hypothetical protein